MNFKVHFTDSLVTYLIIFFIKIEQYRLIQQFNVFNNTWMENTTENGKHGCEEAMQLQQQQQRSQGSLGDVSSYILVPLRSSCWWKMMIRHVTLLLHCFVISIMKVGEISVCMPCILQMLI